MGMRPWYFDAPSLLDLLRWHPPDILFLTIVQQFLCAPVIQVSFDGSLAKIGFATFFIFSSVPVCRNVCKSSVPQSVIFLAQLLVTQLGPR